MLNINMSIIKIQMQFIHLKYFIAYKNIRISADRTINPDVFIIIDTTLFRLIQYFVNVIVFIYFVFCC